MHVALVEVGVDVHYSEFQTKVKSCALKFWTVNSIVLTLSSCLFLNSYMT